ncbi:MAG: NAD-dependent epimerase/dehydratase family protein [Candidatus Thermoplasmatota archaeon]|nr:NAD-dependent epimerase/dehydratase family protein [Candidatus Thermoplasmatota archaeon]
MITRICTLAFERQEKSYSLSAKQLDGVFHLAAITSPPQFEEDPLEGFSVNVMGTLNVLKCASENDVPRVVFASTSSTYGDLKEKASESRISLSHVNLYPLTKVFGELLGKYYSNRDETEVVSVRYFNTYGKGENTKSLYASVVWRFVTAALKSEDIVVYGDGTQSRDFIYIKDTVEGTIAAFEKGKAGESYNIGSGTTQAFNEIAQKVKEITESNSKIVHVSNPLRNYQMFTQADIANIRHDTGWMPGMDLARGISEMIAQAPENESRGN